MCNNGKCVCISGYTGDDCKTEPIKPSPPPSCTTNCNSPYGICNNGKCVCISGYTGDDCKTEPIKPSPSPPTSSRKVGPILLISLSALLIVLLIIIL